MKDGETGLYNHEKTVFQNDRVFELKFALKDS